MSDDDVSTLLGFISDQLTPDQARKLLRQCGSLDAALNKYYDDPASCIQPEDLSYDMSAFAADRTGARDHNSLPSFNIVHADGLENYTRSTTHSIPPSRPPSRTSVRSGASPAHGDVPVQSIEEMQESGVVGTSGNSRPIFGPANRDTYDNSWAMVPYSTSAEMIPDAAPSARKREEDGPAIIKPVPTGNYLPALLTILRTIPSIRNALLTPGVSAPDYAAGDEWWKGYPSIPARTIEYGSDDETGRDLELLYETQRLVAFLDLSNRAYTSVGGLQQLAAWSIERSDLEQSDDDLLKFLLKWGDAYESATNNSLTGVLRTAFDIGGQTRESFFLHANLVDQSPGHETDLYSVIDEQLFDSSREKAHIAHPSNVLVFRLESSRPDATSLNCIIPPIFYADRYLEENKIIVDAMYQEKKIFEDQIREIEARAHSLRYHTARTVHKGKPFNTLKLLETSRKAFEKKPGSLIDDPKDLAVLAHLQSIHDSIEHKLNNLEVQRSKIREALDQMARDFKIKLDGAAETPMDESDGGIDGSTSSKTLPLQLHPYKLCGFSTMPNVYYLKHPNARSGDDWWRLEYSTATSDAYILRERLSQASALEKVTEEHKSVLLVYANDEALNEDPIPLPDTLCQFIKEDNQAFQKELESTLNYEHTTQGIKAVGHWNQAPPEYQTTDVWVQDDWDHVSAKELNEQMNMTAASSTTLTPNADDHEAREFNGGFGVWAGTSSASSDTAGEAMDLAGGRTQHQGPPHGTVTMRDVEMMDLDGQGPDGRRRSPEVQHIEMVEKKGG